MAASRTPGPTTMGDVYDGTGPRYHAFKPAVVGHKAVIRRKRPLVVADSPPREVLVFAKAEFLKYAATVAGLVSPLKDSLTDLRRLVTELGIRGTARLTTYKGEEYIILSGYAGLRKILTGTRYKANHPKVIELVITRTRMIASAIKGTFLTIVLVAGADGLDAYFGDQKAKDELGLTASVDVLKAVAASVIGLAAAAGTAAAIVTAPAWVPVAVGIGVGVAVSYALDKVLPTDNLVAAIEIYYQHKKPVARVFLTAAERDFMDAMDAAKDSFDSIAEWASP